jgi:IrrE N-terminal-like domain
MTDCLVKPLRDEDVRQFAKRLRAYYGVQDCTYVDVLGCLKQKTIWTLRGVRELNYQVRPDSEMGIRDGSTAFGKKIVTISVKQSVHRDAMLGVGRARNTLSHELGHGVLHDGPEMHRSMLTSPVPKYLRPYESSEHQVKIFAPAFLINDVGAALLATAEDIAIEFGISLESADIYFSNMIRERERPKEAARMREQARRLAEDFRRSDSHSINNNIRYLDQDCTVCGQRTVLPIGIKFMCTSCDRVFDHFQDGDP